MGRSVVAVPGGDGYRSGSDLGGGMPQRGTLPPGLVDRQTSYTSGGRTPEFLGRSRGECVRAAARAARFRRLKRTVYAYADQVTAGMQEGGRQVEMIMATLTYRELVQFDRKQITEYCRRQSQILRRKGIEHAYAWVVEMQRRGVPHYHVLWWVPKGCRLSKPDQVAVGARAPLWPHGSTRVELARRCGYIVKYATKFDSGVPVPRGSRLFGIGGTCRAWRRIAIWNAHPSWVRDCSTEGDLIRRCKGGGWLNFSTGELYPARYRFVLSRESDGMWRLRFELREAVCGSG